MRRLKPHEVRALVLKAEGLSYEEICAETGWTYTKVNRCLSEGRRRFHDRVAGIESGAECERLAPLLSALADGEARAEDLAALRPHLRTCLVCRARLREYRAAPGRVAALIPPVAIFPAIVGWLHGRAAAFAARWHAGFEAASASKIAAVTASTAVLAGGGAVGITAAGGGADPRPASDVVSHPAPTPPETATPAAATPSPARERRADDHPRAARGRWPLAQPAPTNTRTSAADEPVSSPPSGELDPAPAARPPEERSGDAPPGEAGEFAP